MERVGRVELRIIGLEDRWAPLATIYPHYIAEHSPRFTAGASVECSIIWCPPRDSNSHTFRYQNLNLARLPISPKGHISLTHYLSYYTPHVRVNLVARPGLEPGTGAYETPVLPLHYLASF